MKALIITTKEEVMPQIVYRGDGEAQVGEFRLIKDQPQDISDKLAEELKAIADQLQERGLELILEPKSKD
jgi:hypothetical protein